MRHILVVALLLTATSLATAQSNFASEPKPFHISSRGTAFGVQADFEGTYLVREDYIEVNVTKATLYVSDHCPYKGRSLLNQLRFGLATYREDGRWKIESSAPPIQLARIMMPKEEASLDPSYLFIPKAKDADLTTRWFIIEIQTDAIDYPKYRPGSGYVFASSCRDIFVPKNVKATQPITSGNGASPQSCQGPKKDSDTLGRN